MSTDAAATHDELSHGHDAEDFHPHITPIWIYIATWLSLMVLTAFTVYVSYLDLGAANLAIALLVATTKATIVALFFMHLKWDLRFHAIIFSFSLIFLGIFIIFTMYDTETRGRNDPQQADRPLNVANPYAGSRGQEALQMKYAVDPTMSPVVSLLLDRFGFEVNKGERGEKIEVRVVPPPDQPPR